MKKNSPVNNTEHHFNENESLYSRTNTKGVITEVNNHFERISGFSHDELCGKAHNIVRHPDVPQAAFDDLWKDLQLGRPWRGIIKNWNKEGGFYWVDANVSPIRDKTRKITGFQSVRFKPNAEEIIAAAQAYQQINSGSKQLYIRHGRVFRKSLLKRLITDSRAQWLSIAALAAMPALLELVGQPSKTIAATCLVLSPALIGLIATQQQRTLKSITQWIGEILNTGNLKISRTQQGSAPRQLAELADRTTDLVRATRATIKGVEDISLRVACAANNSQTVVNDLLRASQTQSEAATSSAAAIEQMTQSISDVSAQTEQTKTSVDAAGLEARQARQESQQARCAINHLVESIQDTAEQIGILGQRSEEIENIVSLIKSIADQTNLLALNAAIEAARAGEHGRGFAVVADEVRGLSERTAKATFEISEMINVIRHDATQAVQAMAQSQEQAHSSMIQVQRVADTLSQISNSMEGAVDRVGQIAHATFEQKNVMDVLAKDIAHISSMADSNVGVAQQAKQTTDELTVLSTRLLDAAQQYQV